MTQITLPSSDISVGKSANIKPVKYSPLTS